MKNEVYHLKNIKILETININKKKETQDNELKEIEKEENNDNQNLNSKYT